MNFEPSRKIFSTDSDTKLHIIISSIELLEIIIYVKCSTVHSCEQAFEFEK